MSETIQLRRTRQNSGGYDYFDSATINGEQVLKGVAIKSEVSESLGDYAQATIDGDEGATLSPKKWTGATGNYVLDGAVRSAYFNTSVLEQLDGFDAGALEKGDTTGLPEGIAVELKPSSEEAYEADKAEQKEEATEAAEEAAEALVSGGDAEESEEADAADGLISEESDDSEETVEISDEEVGIVEN